MGIVGVGGIASVATSYNGGPVGADVKNVSSSISQDPIVETAYDGSADISDITFDIPEINTIERAYDGAVRVSQVAFSLNIINQVNIDAGNIAVDAQYEAEVFWHAEFEIIEGSDTWQFNTTEIIQTLYNGSAGLSSVVFDITVTQNIATEYDGTANISDVTVDTGLQIVITAYDGKTGIGFVNISSVFF